MCIILLDAIANLLCYFLIGTYDYLVLVSFSKAVLINVLDLYGMWVIFLTGIKFSSSLREIESFSLWIKV